VPGAHDTQIFQANNTLSKANQAFSIKHFEKTGDKRDLLFMLAFMNPQALQLPDWINPTYALGGLPSHPSLPLYAG